MWSGNFTKNLIEQNLLKTSNWPGLLKLVLNHYHVIGLFKSWSPGLEWGSTFYIGIHREFFLQIVFSNTHVTWLQNHLDTKWAICWTKYIWRKNRKPFYTNIYSHSYRCSVERCGLLFKNAWENKRIFFLIWPISLFIWSPPFIHFKPSIQTF